MKKRFISTLLVAITTIGALTGCGSSNSNVAQAAQTTEASADEADTAEATTWQRISAQRFDVCSAK